MYAAERLVSQADFGVIGQPLLPSGSSSPRRTPIRGYNSRKFLFFSFVAVHTISIFLMLYVMLNMDGNNDIYSKMTLICFTLWIIMFVLDHLFIIYRSFGNKNNSECIGHNYLDCCSDSHIYYNNDFYCCVCGFIYYPYRFKNILFRYMSYLKPAHVIANCVGYGLYLRHHSGHSINAFYGPFVLTSLIPCGIVMLMYMFYKVINCCS